MYSGRSQENRNAWVEAASWEQWKVERDIVMAAKILKEPVMLAKEKKLWVKSLYTRALW